MQVFFCLRRPGKGNNSPGTICPSYYQFSDYWFCSGPPTLLIDLIRKRKTKIHELDNIESSISRFGNMDVDRIKLTALLFQTGYLTIIKRVKQSIDSEKFIIGSPNKDVRFSFLTRLLENFSDDKAKKRRCQAKLFLSRNRCLF